jgi:hypothetical protein
LPNPETVDRGDMEDHAASLGGGDKSRGVAQIRHDGLDAKAVEVRMWNTRLEQRDDFRSAFQQGPGDGRANEAACARDEHPVARPDRHRRL